MQAIKMNQLIAILFLFFMACKQPEKKPSSTNLKPTVVDSSTSMSPTPLVPGKRYSMDEIYTKYINEELITYIEKNHPLWSVPNQYKWFPQLFNKYKTANSLVNYISGDFDCNGKRDYALLVDNGKNRLAVVAFLRIDSTFKTVELTELSGDEEEKINFLLTLYKPGRYDIIDPDLEPTDDKFVNLKCGGIGIGSFKELYEGGDDVFYWEKNDLRSCLIAK